MSTRRTVDRAKWRFWRFIDESASVLANYSRLKESRNLDAKEDRRVARLTLKQYGFWVRAFADAIGGRLEEETGTLEEKCKDMDIAKRRAWERLYERWPELRGKV
jgi:hypothetical protein